MVLDVALSLWLKETALGVAGLSLANSLAFTVGVGLMLARVRHIAGAADLVSLLPAALRAALATLAALAALAAVRAAFAAAGLTGWYRSGSSLTAFGLLMAEAIPAAVALWAAYAAMGIRVRHVMRGH